MISFLTFLCFLATTLIGRSIFDDPNITMFRPQPSSDNGKDSLLSALETEFEESLKKLEDLKKQEIKNQDDAKAKGTWYNFEEGQNRLNEYDRKMTQDQENSKIIQEIRRKEIETNKNLDKAQRIARAGKLKSLEEIEKQEKEAYENLKKINTLKKQESKHLDNLPGEYKKFVDDLDRRRYENRKNMERLNGKMNSKGFNKLSEAERNKIKQEYDQCLDNSEQWGFDGQDESARHGTRMNESAQRLRDFEKQETEALENIKRIQNLKKQEIDSLINLAKP